MVRYVRYSDRWGPISPVRRVEAFRREDPAEREWVRMLMDDAPRPERKPKTYASAEWFGDASAPLYDEAGKIRHMNALEVGVRMDVHT
ncbi:hypothetical protein [Cohnella candidum]|uniref:Uncharacterized protein n=1 Tax=Cohnella candidum TaxID=2674991 RepID=A0A3G3JTT1_9BACL|nr:hypothetical protein [Cohnella candidum]AYQ71307.1 hypothetical protein EAV92_01090 [Cohnella candidum]